MKRVILLLLAIAVLAGGIFYLRKAEQEDSRKVRTLYAQVEPLERKRQELQQELDKLETSYALKTRDYGTMELFFPTPLKDIYTTVYPILREKDLVGVVGISTQNPLDSYFTMKKEDLQRLVSEGWGICAVYDANTYLDFKSWFEYFLAWYEAYGLPKPTSVYFSNNEYRTSMDEQIQQCGIETVIVNATDGRSNTVTDATGAIWLTGAMPWKYTGFSTDVELLSHTDGANLCFIVDLGNPYIWPYVPWSDQDSLADSQGDEVDLSDKATFQKILAGWKNMIYIESPLDEMEKISPEYPGNSSEVMQELYLESLTTEQQLMLPRFRITTFEGAKQYHVAAHLGNQQIQDEQNQRQTELQQQIDALDVQIRSLYDSFNNQELDFKLNISDFFSNIFS